MTEYNPARNDLISNLLQISQEIDWKMSIPQLALFFSYFYAIILLKPESCRKGKFDIADYENEDSFLRQNLPEASVLFKDTIATKDINIIQKIFYVLRDIILIPDKVDNTVAWIYQALKESLEKKTFQGTRENKQKIQGKDLLYSTQFFTDEYMVKFMVDSCLNEATARLATDNIVFVDPALGGGNFLSYSFLELFKWYASNSDLSASEITNIIITNQIVGYDLDPNIVKIAKLSLSINIASCAGLIEIPTIKYFAGWESDSLGFMKENVLSDTIDNETFDDVLHRLQSSCVIIEYITNPPFMGKRDMDLKLKQFLTEHYPDSKGDLCFSFMDKLSGMLRPEDRMSTVSQNGWLNLSSLMQFRENILDNMYIQYCVDMGSNAFAAINGEKANIILSRIRLKGSNATSQFYNLKKFSLLDKKRYLTGVNNLNEVEYVVNQEAFRKNRTYEFTYELVNSLQSINDYDTYSQFAVPMQGTSTGDNKSFVKYIWDLETDNPDWRLVSKGGGFSKWQGLNIFKVKWGKNGECIINNPGSALRNLKAIPFTDLVYSDTGTLGLNVRLLLKDQVFIASGPGIKIMEGHPYCHMAFLNSRIATCLLKIMNPKFTISAGYIAKLPVKREILVNETIANLGKSLVEKKVEFLSTKLPNLEYQPEDFSTITDIETYIDNLIIRDIENYKLRSILETEINRTIFELFKFNKVQKKVINKFIETRSFESVFNADLVLLDKTIVSNLNLSCYTVSRKLKNSIFGSENLLEILSYELSTSVESLSNILCEDVRELRNVRNLYKRDLLHKLILHVCGINRIMPARVRRSISDIDEEFRQSFPYLHTILNVDEDVVREIINDVHFRVFCKKPIIFVS